MEKIEITWCIPANGDAEHGAVRQHGAKPLEETTLAQVLARFQREGWHLIKHNVKVLQGDTYMYFYFERLVFTYG